MNSKLTVAGFITVSPSLIACGHTAAKYRPIVDNAKDAHYEANLQECQQVATQRGYLNDDVKSEAALGAGIGTVVGAVEDGVEGALGGAVVGAVLHGAGRSWATRDERKQIVVECMRQRGHRVVG